LQSVLKQSAFVGGKIEVQLKGKKWSLVQAAFTDFGSVVQLAQFCSAQFNAEESFWAVFTVVLSWAFLFLGSCMPL
jgi:hypothetical protein